MAGNMDWEVERLYVMEMLKDNKKGLEGLEKSVNDYKLETAKAIAELQTKVGIYVLIGASIVSTAISVIVGLMPWNK